MSDPDFIFISEPLLYQCDLFLEMNFFKEEYSSNLSSDDLHDHNLPLTGRRAKGGTLALWKSKFDPYVTSLPSVTSSFMTIIFAPKYATPSIHITVYLPTSGREDDRQ